MSDERLSKIEATLKECPCCAYKVVIEPYKARKGFECTIHCNNCMVSLTTITYDTEEEAIDAAVKMWNTRKPMERIVEKLEDTKGVAFLTLANTGDTMKDIVYDEVAAYLNTAIEIVKGSGVDETD